VLSYIQEAFWDRTSISLNYYAAFDHNRILSPQGWLAMIKYSVSGSSYS